MNEITEFWDNEAKKLALEGHVQTCAWDMGLKASKAGLNNLELTKNGEINLLKADLWNEGVKYERDVLGHLPKQSNINLFGMDISKIVCSLAKARLKNVHVVRGDIRRIPFREGSFHLILDLSTLDHVSPDQTRSVIHEYHRILAGGGILVLLEDCWNFSWVALTLLEDCWNFFVKHVLHVERGSGERFLFQRTGLKKMVKELFTILKECHAGALYDIPQLTSGGTVVPERSSTLIKTLLTLFDHLKLSFVLKSVAFKCLILAQKQWSRKNSSATG